jgi:hypothetical protein
MTIPDLKPYILHEGRGLIDFDLQLKTNLAAVYYLKTGQVVMLAGDLSDFSKGILFDNKECFSDFVAEDHFPINNNRPVIEEAYQEYVLAIDNKMESIVGHLSDLTGVKVNSAIKQATSLSELLIELRARSKKLSRKDWFLSALLLGEYVRRERKASWIILKRYGTFNPYYTPAILNPNGTVVLFWDYLKSFFDIPGDSPEQYCNLPWIKDSQLKVDGGFIKNNFKGYKILTLK